MGSTTIIPNMGGEVRLVTDGELQHLTSGGMRLLATVEDDFVGYDSYNPQTQRHEKQAPVRRVRFLLEQSADEVREEQRQRIAELEQTIHQVRAELSAAQSAQRSTADKLAVSEKREQEARVLGEGHCVALNRERDRARKLEVDIGKVREEIGRAKFDEIVGRSERRASDEAEKR